MAYPDALPTVKVTHRPVGTNGKPLVGSASAVLTGRMWTNSGSIIPTEYKAQIVDGAYSFDLPPVDHPKILGGNGEAYLITEYVPGQPRSFHIAPLMVQVGQTVDVFAVLADKPAPGGGINYITGPATDPAMAGIALTPGSEFRGALADVLAEDSTVAQAAADRAVTVAADPAVAGTFAAAGSATRTEADKHYAAAVEIDVTKYATPQAAVNAAQALGVPVTVNFGRGTYTLPAPLNVTASNVTLELGRARIVTNHSGTAITITGTSAQPLSGAALVGGVIELDSKAASGVHYKHCTGPIARNVRVQNAAPAAVGGVGVHFEDCTDPIADVRATRVGTALTTTRSPGGEVNVVARDTMRDGVNIYNGSHDTTVRANVRGYNTSGDGGRAGVQFYGSNGVTLASPRVESGTVGGTPDSPKVRFRDCRDFTINGGVLSGPLGGGISIIVLSDIGTGGGGGTVSGVTVKGSAGYGIQVSLGAGGQVADMEPVAITGNIIKGVRVQGANAGYGLQLQVPASLVAATGNTIYDCDGDGILSNARATITGNTIWNVGKGTLGGKVGIYATGGEAVVEGNTVIDDQTVGTMSYCLRVAATATCHLGVNNFKRASAITIWNQGTTRATAAGVTGALLGFYGKEPVVRPAGVAVTPEAIHASLVQLGLIAA